MIATFETTVLPSGLRVVSSNLAGSRSVALSIGFGAGSAHESEEEAGWAHLLEHLQLSVDAVLARSREQTRLLKSLGAEFNASTEAEATVYTFQFARRHWAAVTDVIERTICRPALSQDALNVERLVVEAEASSRGADHFSQFSWNTLSHLLAGTPFARSESRTSFGNAKTLAAAGPKRLARWRQRGYAARNAWVVACGAIDHAELVAWAEGLGLPAGAGFAAPDVSGWSPAGDTHLVMPDYDQTHVALSWPTFGQADSRSLHISLISAYLGGGPGSRLFDEIRGQRGLAYSLFTDHLQYSGVGALQFVMQTSDPDYADEATAIAHELVTSGHIDLSDADFAHLKSEMAGRLEVSSDSPLGRMSIASSHIAAYGRVRQLDEIVARIEAVALDELKDTWREFLRPERVCLSRLN